EWRSGGGGRREERGGDGCEAEGRHGGRHRDPPGHWVKMRCRCAGEGWHLLTKGVGSGERYATARGGGTVRTVRYHSPLPTLVRALGFGTPSRCPTARRSRPLRPHRTTSRSRGCARPTACARSRGRCRT